MFGRLESGYEINVTKNHMVSESIKISLKNKMLQNQ